jgi:hypothetical protein
MFVTCIMGYFFYMNSRGRLPHGQLLRITGSLFFLILAGLFVSADLGDKRYSLMCSFLSWSGAYALFILFFATRFLKTHFDLLFVYLGSISYSVYLVHCLLIPVLSIYLGTSFWLLIVGPVLSIGAATFTYRYIEQPGIRLGKSLAEVIVASSGRLAFPNERLDGSGQGVARICRPAEPREAGQRRKEQKVSDEFHVFPFRSVLTQSSLASSASAMSLCGLFCLAACRTYGDDGDDVIQGRDGRPLSRHRPRHPHAFTAESARLAAGRSFGARHHGCRRGT